MYSVSKSIPACETPAPPRIGARALIGFLAYVAGYLALVAWFKFVDVYHAHFATTGALVAVHNLCRVLFIFYLFWIVHAVGALALRAFGRAADHGIGTLEHLALAFFTGAGIWHVGLFGIGYLGLYTVPVALALTVPAIALSYWNLRAAVSEARAVLRRGITTSSFIWAAILMLVGTALLIVKGLYPSSGHDYVTHYFHYYSAVIDNGNIWPNEVWYHYYYLKGAGLVFLGMLLTDPLAPQPVTFCFFSAMLLVLHLVLRRIGASTTWSYGVPLALLALYIRTPGPTQIHADNGGWGDFEKTHELTAALVVAVLWTGAAAVQAHGRARLVWLAGAASASIAAVLVSPEIGVYLGGIFAILATWYLIRRHLVGVGISVALGAVAALALISIAAINQLTSGLISDQAIHLFWPYADLERLRSWGGLINVIVYHQSHQGMINSGVPLLSFQVVTLVLKCLRLELLLPVAIVGAFVALAAIRARRWSVPSPHDAAAFAAAALMIAVLAATVGRGQMISFYRYTSFGLPIAMVLAVVLWTIPTGDKQWFARLARDRRVHAWVLIGSVAIACIVNRPRVALLQVVASSAAFATGVYSIDMAYANQRAWPARMPWSSMHPAARAAYNIVGARTRIWSLHVHTYCMLPDCRVQQHNAFIMTPDWDRLMFGTAEEGRELLQTSGVNYFLISFATNIPITDPLPRSALFSPDNIARYLGIRWTDGTTALLTWRGPDTVPLDDQWLADYRGAVASSGIVASFPSEEMRDVFARLRAMPHPWQPFPLEWRGR